MSDTHDNHYIKIAFDRTQPYHKRANATLKIEYAHYAKELRKLTNDTIAAVRHSAVRVLDTKMEQRLLEQIYTFDSDYDVRLLARRKLAKIGVILPKEPVPM